MDQDLTALMEWARERKQLANLARETGVSYSYLTKLSSGHKPLGRVGSIYRRVLLAGLRQLRGDEHAIDTGRGGEAAARGPAPGLPVD